MPGYAKLFSSIIHSTIWREPDHRRILWVTMLALKDQHGVVEASVPGLADAARISLESVLDGLLAFQQPDRWSRNQSEEGRRIREVQGGWLVLNHQHYRDLMSLEERRARDAERKRLARSAKNVLGLSADAGQVRDVSHTDQIQIQMQDPPIGPPRDPKPKPKPKREPRRKARVIRPDPFAADESKATLGAEKDAGLTRNTRAYALELQKFCNHHDKVGSLFANWQAAWRTWLSNVREFAGPEKPAMPTFDEAMANVLQERS